MKNLIKDALDKAIVFLDKQIPQTKSIRKYSDSIMDVSPLDMADYMKANDIPMDATFDGVDNGYDGWDDFVLSWLVDVPTTDDDKLKFRRKRFRDLAWRQVHDSLLANGYNRVGYSTALLKQFDDTTVYDMYIAGDYARLVKYYSLPFIKQ